jgi:hypothetical protein
MAGPRFKAGAIDISSVGIPLLHDYRIRRGELIMKQMFYSRQLARANGIVGTQADH